LNPLWADHNIFGENPFRIGIIHSLTGTLAENEKPMVNAALMAVKEFNDHGGILNIPIETVVVDSKSDSQLAAKLAEKLIVEEKVDVIYGCWTSSCRKAVLPIVEKHNHLLIYPMQYEGFEQSDNIIYTGLTANQQIIPVIKWAFKNKGKRLYLIGSDYVFPRYSNTLIKQLSKFFGFEVIAEKYLPLGSTKVEELIQDIVDKQPELIINTINGDTNKPFFTLLSQQKTDFLNAIISLSVDQHSANVLPSINNKSYTAWSYYEQFDNDENKRFIKNYQSLYGSEQKITDPMISAYISIKLWIATVKLTQTAHSEVISHHLVWQSISSPFGILSLDRYSRHTYRPLTIAQHKENKQTRFVWFSNGNIQPDPFPLNIAAEKWQKILESK